MRTKAMLIHFHCKTPDAILGAWSWSCGYKLLHLRDERYNNSTIKQSSFAWDDQISDDFKVFVLLNTLKMSPVMCDCG